MRSLTAYVVGLQGAFGIFNGAASLIVPSVALKNCQTLNIHSVPAIHTIALGSITVGGFYLLAAVRNDTTAYWLMGLGRIIAIAVFSYHGGPWSKVAVFEGICAVMVGAALGWERRNGSNMMGDKKYL